jgi:hypothetical protein
MSDATYQPKVYMADGGDEMVVADGGKITADGTQASAVADATVNYTGTNLTTDNLVAGAINATNTKINSIIAALEGVGILAE